MPDEPELRSGDVVLITDGPFAGFTGPVRSLDDERGRVGVVVEIFGDKTLIDIPLSAVEKTR